MRFHVLALLLLVLQASAVDTWTRVSDFPAQRLHALGQTVVAWDQARVAVSLDGGYSWSQAITPAPQANFASAPIGITTATVTPQGPVVILANGQPLAFSNNGLVPAGMPPVSGIEVAGNGDTYLEGADGVIYKWPGMAVVARGRIYRPVASGILVQTGGASLQFVSGTTASPVEYSGRQLPPVFELAAPTSKGIDRWVSKDGTLWQFKDGKVVDLNRRPVAMANSFASHEGYQEYLVYQGQAQITWAVNSGMQVHRRTEGLPKQVQRVAAGDNSFIACNPEGIWVVDINRTR